MARCTAAAASAMFWVVTWSCWLLGDPTSRDATATATTTTDEWALSGSRTSPFVRPLEASVDMPLDADVFQVPPGFNAPQQVHIAQGDYYGKAVIVSWITPYLLESPDVCYGPVKGNYSFTATAELTTTYTAYNYTSGFIHHCTLEDLEVQCRYMSFFEYFRMLFEVSRAVFLVMLEANLSCEASLIKLHGLDGTSNQYNTTYFYKLGDGNVSREFSFTTPPEAGPDVPYTFGLIGDLGQTADSNTTLQHYLQSKGQALLFVGDCSYADKYPFYDNNRWDTWGRFVERSTAYQPWIWTGGNHDIESGPDFEEFDEFKAFVHRLRTPFTRSGSTSPLWYSIQRGPAYVISLSSYSSFVKFSPQYKWLNEELQEVDRTKTPWLIVIMHVPLYNSNSHHYLEGEAMRSVFEAWFVDYKVDIVFAGHVHAYERSYRISNVLFNLTNGACQPVLDDDAPVHVVIGDGGNVEGLAVPYIEPQPEYSAFREASFGHGILDIMNRTHALFSWHRNQDGQGVVADSFWLNNQYWKSTAASSS